MSEFPDRPISGESSLSSSAARFFLEVSRSTSIRQAAERLGVTPSAVSRQIMRLEQEFTAQLVERRSDGIQLTEAGHILTARLQEIQNSLSRISGELAELRALRRGKVEISTVSGILRPFLSNQIADFRRRHPGVSVHLRACGRARVIEALEERQSQIGFIYDHFNHPSLMEVGRWRQPLLALAPPRHPLHRQERLTLQDLAGLPLAVPDTTFGIHHLVVRAFARAGLVADMQMQSDSLEFLRAYSVAADCVTFMPLQAALTEVSSGHLLPLPLDCPEFRHRHIHAICRRDVSLPPATEVFLRETVAAFDAANRQDGEIMSRLLPGQL